MTDTLQTLQDFHAEKLAMLLRHQAAARVIEQYDVNNTYQYVVNREEVQLTWLANAIVEMGAQPAPGANVSRTFSGRGAAAAREAIEADARDAQEFVDRWIPRVRHMQHARHAKMLNVILGETLEQKRFFEQALAGRTDLLGKRGDQVGPAFGTVLPSRWIE